MQQATAYLLEGGKRLHLQHGPIDLVIGVDTDDPRTRKQAYQSASRRFDGILTALVSELPFLKSAGAETKPKGTVAQRMVHAIQPHARTSFVTPMAAVAGSVADEVLEAILASSNPNRAYVNNGGDIAVHLNAGQHYSALIAGLNGATHGQVTIDAASPVRGIATSGRGGRSLSMGIADSVTVLAKDAAAADVAATLIANAVDLPGHVAITRHPANSLDTDSDLGARLVVTELGLLNMSDVEQALDAGAKAAETMFRAGLITAAALFLRGAQRIVGQLPHQNIQNEVKRYARS